MSQTMSADFCNYAGGGVIGCHHKCTVTRTGAIGSIGDGCVDNAEWAVTTILSIVMIVAITVALYKFKIRLQVVAAVAASVVVSMSSFYHFLFGENDTRTTAGAATAALDTRNVTVPITLLALAAVPLACGFRASALVIGAAAVVALAVTNAAAAQHDAAAAVEDGFGFVSGIVAVALIVGDRPVYVKLQRAAEL